MPPIFREPDSEAWHHIIHPGSRGLRRLFVRWSFLQSGLVCVIEVGLVCMVVLSDFSELSSVTLCHHWQIRKLKISIKANISRNIKTTQVNPLLSLLQVVASFRRFLTWISTHYSKHIWVWMKKETIICFTSIRTWNTVLWFYEQMFVQSVAHFLRSVQWLKTWVGGLIIIKIQATQPPIFFLAENPFLDQFIHHSWRKCFFLQAIP